MDKTAWGPGPWQDECDKEQYADPATGMPCLVKRNRITGSLCGYVGVSEGHPWFGKGYDDLAGFDADGPDVHGGLTFADFCQEGDEAHTICHVPGPGEPDRVYWLGFDCAHAWDLSPAMRAQMQGLGMPDYGSHETYRDVSYVKEQCAGLAAQAVAAASVDA